LRNRANINPSPFTEQCSKSIPGLWLWPVGTERIRHRADAQLASDAVYVKLRPLTIRVLHVSLIDSRPVLDPGAEVFDLTIGDEGLHASDVGSKGSGVADADKLAAFNHRLAPGRIK